MKKILQIIGLLAFLAAVAPGAKAVGGTCPTQANMDGGNANGVSFAAPTSCYYVASAGVDTNTGTDETHPFKHGKGQAGCANNCSSATQAGGIGWIFKGGDTWDSTNLPYSPGASGGAGGNDGYSGCGGANCIYIGVDHSWFTGGTWTRPIFSGGDWGTPPTGSGASYSGGTCTYDMDNSGGTNRFLNLINQKDIIIDNIEFTGACLQTANVPPGGNNPSYISSGGSMANVTIENCYFHRPAYNIGSSSNNAAAFDVVNGGGTYHYGPFNVTDFTDSGPVNHFVADNGLDGFTCCAGLGAIQTYVDYNVFYGMGAAEDEIGVLSRNNNFYQDYNATVYGQSFHEHLSNDGACVAGATITNYNNVMSALNTVAAAQNYGFDDSHACTYYVWGDVMEGLAPPFYAYASGANGNTFHFFNITVEAQDSSNGGPGSQTFTKGGGTTGTDIIGNLHMITAASQCTIFNIGTGAGGFAALGTWTTSAGSTSAASFTSFPGCPVTDIVVQSQATANGQGYLKAQTYMFSPTSSGNATVGKGVNHTADCTAIASSNAAQAALAAAACQKDTSYAVTYNQTNHTAVLSTRTPVARPTSGAWDAGAYQFQPLGPGCQIF